MRLQASLLVVLSCLSLCIDLSLANPLDPQSLRSRSLQLRHGDDHMSMSEEGPLTHINETEVLQYHDPDPVAYYQYDYENATPDLSPEELEGFDIENRHAGLMLFHAFTMIASYLFILPISIVLANTRHRLLWLAQTSFWALNLLGYSAATAYKRNTPNMYKGSTHGTSGNVLIFLAALTTLFEVSPAIFRQIPTICTRTSSINYKWRGRLPIALPRLQLSQLSLPLPLFRRSHSQEYAPMVTSPLMASPIDEEEPKTAVDPESGHLDNLDRLRERERERERARERESGRGSQARETAEVLDYRDEIDMLESDKPHPTTSYTAFNNAASSSYASRPTETETERAQLFKRHSMGSDHSTLHEEQHNSHHSSHNFKHGGHQQHVLDNEKQKPISRWMQYLMYFRAAYKTLECALVVYAWGQILSGFAIYVGFGRSQYINGILAHFIKGSIFFWYGILTFARYIGAWRRWGWAWNEPPAKSQAVSAAFVESLVIFLYGFTQQFMERFGKHPGDPYTAKDIEHISIAVMFWGGGLVSMAVESPKMWKWMFDVDPDTDVAAAMSVDEEANFHPSTSTIAPNIVSPSSEPSSSSAKKTRFDSPTSSKTAYIPPLPLSSSSVPIPVPVPTTKRASNPLPALVIGVTGIAMSAHHQTYLFQVQIHALWGYLLLGFSICRCLTCFFEWVRPQLQPLPRLQPLPLSQLQLQLSPQYYSYSSYGASSDEKERVKYHVKGRHRKDMMGTTAAMHSLSPSPSAAVAATAATLPGRPPSELVGSVFLGAGGITFICSSEQITFWAMRNHKDDVMMFLNLAIAFTCVAYVWTTVVILVNAKANRVAKIRL